MWGSDDDYSNSLGPEVYNEFPFWLSSVGVTYTLVPDLGTSPVLQKCSEYRIWVSLSILMLDLVTQNYPEALLLAAFADAALRSSSLYLRIWLSWTFCQFVTIC